MTFHKLSDETLREHKGKSFPGIGVVFVCHDGQGNLFLAQRSNKSRDERGRWAFGGGGLKHGETVEDCLLREVKEEYSATPLSFKFLGYRDVVKQDEDSTKIHWVFLSFTVRVDPKEIVISEPEMFDNSGWFTLDKLPNPMFSGFDLFMKLYGDELKTVLES